MDALEQIHAATIGSHCFGQIYNHLDILGFLELQNSADETRPVDKLLLKLTVIYRLFQLSISEKKTCEKFSDVCSYLMSNDITRKLISCLQDENQYVVFMTSKALSSLMLSMPLTSKNKSELKGLFHDCNNSEWKALYVMNILKHVLEAFRGICNQDHNTRVQSKTLPVCTCVGSTSISILNREENNIELIEFILSKDWISILPIFVPFWEEMFESCLEDAVISEQNELIKYHAQLNTRVHLKLVEGCFDISAKRDQVFVSFLNFLTEFFKWAIKSWHKKSSKKIVTNGRSIKILERNEEIVLLKVMPVIPYILHVNELSSEVWKKILNLLSYCLDTSTPTQGAHCNKEQIPNAKHVFNSAVVYICAVNSSVLDNIPVHAGCEGFGGNKIKPVKEIPKETCKIKVVNRSIFRLASLSVFQASLILFISCENDRNDNLRQVVLKAINIWYVGLLKIGSSNHSNQEAYQRDSSSHNNQEACQRHPSSHSNQEACQRKPSMILMQIFADQDDQMIKMMLLLLQFFKVSSSEPVDQDVSSIIHALHPHLIFPAFLDIIGFDHSVLLDFLMSSETVFLEYLMEYLRFVVHDWRGFLQHSSSLVEGTIATDDHIDIKDQHSMTSYRQGHHSNVSATVNPPHRNTIFPLGMLTINEANSENLCSKASSVGLGCLSDIFFAYGSDSEDGGDDNDDDDDKNSTRVVKNYSGGQVQLRGVDINGGDKTKCIYNCDTVYHRNRCDDDRNQSDGYGCDDDTKSRCKSERNQEDSDIDGDRDDDGGGGGGEGGGEGDDGGDDGDGEGGEGDGGGNDGGGNDGGGNDNGDDGAGDGAGDGSGDVGCRSKHDNFLSVHESEVALIDFDDEMCAANIPHKSATSCQSTRLEKIMSTLIHTRIAAERLNQGCLFPYQAKPLINLMKKVENLYDGC